MKWKRQRQRKSEIDKERERERVEREWDKDGHISIFWPWRQANRRYLAKNTYNKQKWYIIKNKHIERTESKDRLWLRKTFIKYERIFYCLPFLRKPIIMGEGSSLQMIIYLIWFWKYLSCQIFSCSLHGSAAVSIILLSKSNIQCRMKKINLFY